MVLVQKKGPSCGKSRGRSNMMFGCIVHEVCFRPQHPNPSAWYISLQWDDRLQLGKQPHHDSTHARMSVWVCDIFRYLGYEVRARGVLECPKTTWAVGAVADQTKLILPNLPSFWDKVRRAIWCYPSPEPRQANYIHLIVISFASPSAPLCIVFGSPSLTSGACKDCCLFSPRPLDAG